MLDARSGAHNDGAATRFVPHSRLQTSALGATSKRVTSLPLLNHKNTFFTGQISVGDQEDVFEVIFDTGSSLTFITSAHCQARGCKNANQYNSKESDTHQDLESDVNRGKF